MKTDELLPCSLCGEVPVIKAWPSSVWDNCYWASIDHKHSPIRRLGKGVGAQDTMIAEITNVWNEEQKRTAPPF